jgi:single-strand DNA-binding protein
MNSCHLIGRLTKDIELKYSNSGIAFASFNLAVNRQFKKEGEERQADFINCKVFGKTAEFMNGHFSKGSQIGVDGRIQTGSYDKDGTRIYTTDIVVERVYFADSKKSDSYEPQAQSDNSQLGFMPVYEGELPF